MTNQLMTESPNHQFMNKNRRSFIKTATILGTGLFVQPALSCQTKTPPKSSTKKLGVALVGLGYYSRDLLAPALQLTKHCELRGIVTGSPEKIPVWQKQYGIKDTNVYNYDNLHEIANNDDIDVVYVVVPTALHAKYSIIAANAGKHVWCEKPMAKTVAQCQSIINTCRKNKVKLSIGYRMQHEPNTQTVIAYAKSKPYGDIVDVLAEAGYAGGGGSGWRFEKAMGGGAMYDMGVYTVNGIRYATNDEVAAVLEARHIIDRPQFFTEVDETTEYTVRMKSGVIAKGRTSVGRSFNQLRVNCKNGWYELRPMQSYSGVQGQTSDGILLNKPIENQQARQMDNDALAIINNTNVLVPGIEGLKDIRVVEAIFESAASGKVVEL